MGEKSKILILVIILFFGNCNSPETSNFSNSETIISRLAAEPDLLNPILSSNGYAKQVTNHIFSFLVQYDYKTLEISPMLAVELPIIKTIQDGVFKGNQSSIYQIHKNATWDNGTPITGKDVAFTIKAILNPKVSSARLRTFFNRIKAIQVDENNPKNFTIITKGKYFLIQELFANVPIFPAYHYDPDDILNQFSINELIEFKKLPPESNQLLQKFADSFHHPDMSRTPNKISGSGPYQLKEWLPGQRIILEKKDNWWGSKKEINYPLLTAKPNKIIFKIIPDLNTSLTLLKSNQLDVMGGIQADQFLQLKKDKYANTLLNFHSPSSMIYYFIAINRHHPYLSDKKVRRAIAHLLNIEELIQFTQSGFAKRSIGPIYSTKSYFNSNLIPIELDLKKAKALLHEAGWRDTNNNGILDKLIDGKIEEFKLNYLINPGKTGNAIGLILKEKGRLVGIDVEINKKEFRTKMEIVKKREFDLVLLATGFDYSLDDLRQVWHTSSDTPNGGNRTGFGNKESDQIIELIELEIDPQKRKELYFKFQELIYHDQPAIFLFSTQQNIAINKKIKGTVSEKRPGFFENLLSFE